MQLVCLHPCSCSLSSLEDFVEWAGFAWWGEDGIITLLCKSVWSWVAVGPWCTSSCKMKARWKKIIIREWQDQYNRKMKLWNYMACTDISVQSRDWHGLRKPIGNHKLTCGKPYNSIRIWIHRSRSPLSHESLSIQVRVFITISEPMSTLTPNDTLIPNGAFSIKAILYFKLYL